MKPGQTTHGCAKSQSSRVHCWRRLVRMLCSKEQLPAGWSTFSPLRPASSIGSGPPNLASRIIFLPQSAPTLAPGLFFCPGRLQLCLQDYFSAPVGSNFASRIIFLPRSAPTLPPGLFFCPGRLQLCLQNYFSAPVGSNFASRIIFPPLLMPTLAPGLFRHHLRRCVWAWFSPRLSFPPGV